MLLFVCTAAYGQAYTCEPAACQLPDCHCASTDAPGDLSRDETPQFVLIGVDDCLSEAAYEAVGATLEGHQNPDARPIPTTWFVHHLDASSCSVPELVMERYRGGDEIATHTRYGDTGAETTQEEWMEEIGGLVEQLVEAGIAEEHVRGFRAPRLATNAALFDAVPAVGLSYTSTLPDAPFYAPISGDMGEQVWPHTLDAGSGAWCSLYYGDAACPETTPGLWDIPVWTFADPSEDICGDEFCGAFDIGVEAFGGPAISDPDDVRQVYLDNFMVRYEARWPSG